MEIGVEIGAAGEAMAEEESLQEQLDAALEQVEKDKQDYLMLMADFDNYRKRMMREKADLLKNAAERVLTGLLPVLLSPGLRSGWYWRAFLR